jgi:hypothetical protein
LQHDCLLAKSRLAGQAVDEDIGEELEPLVRAGVGIGPCTMIACSVLLPQHRARTHEETRLIGRHDADPTQVRGPWRQMAADAGDFSNLGSGRQSITERPLAWN